ncbi:MAG: hypothetical protein QXZ53_04285 [Candidatus Bathyarchaeia archaeon]
MKVGIGAIGCGFVGGKAHIPSFNSIPEAKLIAIADKDENTAKNTQLNIMSLTIWIT